jgi:imidazolonepropionase-like amidohydrolase
VTTVLDAGGLTPDTFALRERVRAGDTLGPHLYAAGPMFTTPGGHPVGFFRTVLPWWLAWYVIPRFTREVATPDEARAAVAALLPERPDVVKITVDEIAGFEPRLPADVLGALVAAAHAGHVRAVAHIGHSSEALDAVRAGIDALLHDVYVEDISAEAVAAVAAAHVPVAATLAIFDAVEGSTSARADFLPLEREVGHPAVLAALASVPPSFDARPFAPFAQTVRAAHDARRRNVGRLRAAGVTILAGSDAPAAGLFPGVGLHVELEKLVEAGLTPGEALRAATVDNARFLAGPDADFGEIAPGKRADLLLVDGDPLARIGDTTRIAHVVLDGVVLERRPPAPAS